MLIGEKLFEGGSVLRAEAGQRLLCRHQSSDTAQLWGLQVTPQSKRN